MTTFPARHTKYTDLEEDELLLANKKPDFNRG